MKNTRKTKVIQEKDMLVRDIVLFLAALIVADFLVILYFDRHKPAPQKPVAAANSINEIAAEEY